MLAGQRTPGEDALDGLSHVQPGGAQRRVERHDAIGDEPQDEVRRFMTGQIIQHQEHAQGRQRLGQGEAHHQPILPALPLLAYGGRVCPDGRLRQLRQNLGQLLLEPWMQYPIRATSDPIQPHATGCRMKQC